MKLKMLTYSPSYGTSYVHVESGSEGMAASAVARLLLLPHFSFHFVGMLLLQDLRVQFKKRVRERNFQIFSKYFYF